MSGRKIEIPRSEMLYESAGYYPFFPIIDEESLRLARLFAKEEKLAALIADDNGVVNQDTIYKIVTMARKIAKEGYPTTLVSANDMLDIAQTFCLRDPHTARIAQELVLEDPQAPKGATRLLGQAYLEYVTTLPTGPDADTASNILIKLLASLNKSGNSVWTARVAAALAYFSTSKIIQSSHKNHYGV